MKKAQAQVKAIGKSKKDIKESEREMHKMRKELIELKDMNKLLNAKIQELNEGSVKQRSTPNRV